MERALIATGIAVLLFYLILTADVSSNVKILLSIALLYAYGMYAQRLFHLEGGHGLLLYKNRGVVEAIKAVAHRLPLRGLTDVFLLVSFGLLPLRVLKGGLKRKAILYGLALIAITAIALAYPLSFLFLLSYIEGSGGGGGQPLFYVVGVGGAATLSVWDSALQTVGEIWGKLTAGGEAKAKATLLLPGINLPLLEGLLALAVVLIVHEFAHGVVAVREGIRLSSAGVLFFGFLPVGGFVEPDEAALKRASKLSRLRVYTAGTMANFITALFALALLIAFATATAPLAKEGCLVVGGTLEKGTFIYAKGESCIEAKPNEEITLQTDRGEITVKANDEGKIGVYVLKYSKEGLLRYYGNGLDFIYNFLALLFALNMMVGVVNLLPAFVFDGAKMVEELLPEKAAKAINVATFIALLLLFLPALL